MSTIAKFRRKHQFTQIQLAGLLGWSERSIRRWESPASPPPLYVTYALVGLAKRMADWRRKARLQAQSSA